VVHVGFAEIFYRLSAELADHAVTFRQLLLAFVGFSLAGLLLLSSLRAIVFRAWR
jgi:hypothetical protein